MLERKNNSSQESSNSYQEENLKSSGENEQISSKEIIKNKRGLLVKQGKNFGFRVKRYFYIEGDCLIYFKSRDQQKVQGIITLYSSKFEQVDSFLKQYPYCFEITGFLEAFTIWIFAASENELDFYQKYLQKASSGQLSSSKQNQHILNVSKQLIRNQQQLQQQQVSDSRQSFDVFENSKSVRTHSKSLPYRESQQLLKEESDCNIDMNDENDIPNTQQICTYEFAMQNIKTLSKQQIYIEPKSSKIKNFDSSVCTMKKTRLKKLHAIEESFFVNQSFIEGPGKMLERMKFQQLKSIKFHHYNKKPKLIKINKKLINNARGASKSYHGIPQIHLAESLDNSMDCSSFIGDKEKNTTKRLPDFFYGQLHHLEPFDGDQERPNFMDINDFELTTEEENIIDGEDESVQKFNFKVRDFKTNQNGVSGLKFAVKLKKQVQSYSNTCNSCDSCDSDNVDDFIQDIPPNIQQSQLRPHFFKLKYENLENSNCTEIEDMGLHSEQNCISKIIGNYHTRNLIQKDFSTQNALKTLKSMELDTQTTTTHLQKSKQRSSCGTKEDFASEQESFEDYENVSMEDPQITMKKKIFNSNCLHSDQNYKPTLMKGVKAMWQFQMKEARKQFALYNLEHSQIYEPEIVILELIVSGEKSKLEKCENRYDFLLKNVQNKHHSLSQSLDEIYKLAIISEIYLIKGMLNCFQNQKFQALVNLNNSYQGIKKVKRLIVQNTIGHEAKNRILFIEGIYNLGLALIPSIFSKLLSAVGISADYAKGVKLLKECVNMYSIRSYWASIILSMYYFEVDKNYELAHEQIRSTFHTDSYKSVGVEKRDLYYQVQSPVCYWIHSLISWKQSHPLEAIFFINQSISCCGDFKEQAYFLHFEIGWYSLTQTDWQNALKWFELVLVYSQEIKQYKFTPQLNKIFDQYASSPLVKTDQYFQNFIQQYQNNETKVTFPHKVSVLVILAICHIALERDLTGEAFLLCAIYLDKTTNEDKKSNMDIEFGKLAKVFCKRKVKKLLIFEILYFVKEFDKLPKVLQENLKVTCINHIQQLDLQQIESNGTAFTNEQLAVEKASACLLQICVHYIWEELEQLQEVFQENERYFNMLPQQHRYIAHHAYHWVAVSYFMQNQFQQSKRFLNLQLGIKKVEFDLSKKALLFIKDKLKSI